MRYDVGYGPFNMDMMMPSLILIDNYDSFTWNLVHLIAGLGAEVKVYRNDEMNAQALMAQQPDGFVLSPGPCDPAKAGVCLDLLKQAAGRYPILGVCLGHQAIGEAYGGILQHTTPPVHGKVSAIHHEGEGLFAGLPSPFEATRYHSLMIERASLPETLKITAQTADGAIMGLAHVKDPTYGVQFHPESILTQHGAQMIQNFLNLMRDWRQEAA